MCLAHLSPRVVRRWGRRTIAFGFSVIAAGFVCAILVLHVIGPRGSPFDLMPAMGLIGAGQSFVNAPLFSTVLSETPRGHEGSASGIMTTMSQSGSAIGVAFLGLVFFTALGGDAGLTGRIPAASATTAFATSLTVILAINLVSVALVRRLPSLDRLYGPVADDTANGDLAPADPSLAIAPEGLG
jgi:MFS family permease